MSATIYELSHTRRSIRKYKETTIPIEDIEYFIQTAMTAPSGCNSQCWHFVAVREAELIQEIADAVADRARAFYGGSEVDFTEEFLANRAKATSFFRNAPLVIFVFMDKLEYHDSRVTQFFTAAGMDHRQMMDYLGYPDVLSIGAAIENMLLAIHEKGYGACWMNDPVVAEQEIKRLLQVDAERKLISVIPVGVSAYQPRPKALKPLNEVLEIR